MRAADTAVPVPPLAGRLPLPCRKDVSALRRLIHSKVAREVPADAVPAGEFKEVFLTGATGFVGRFVLRELLEQNESLVVHCLVRADSDRQGLERVRGALESAEIWEDRFASRLKAKAGDIAEENLGLPKGDYQGLCQRIDAVYHLAADVGLVRSYDEIREANVLSLGHVFDLCLRIRFKQLFHFSTMAVFPEYFCNFAREFRRCRIEDQMQPDLNEMKKIFPLGMTGYSWSKLVAEQAVLFARSAGVPVAVFRLPQMGLSSTGYTQPGVFPTRLFAAATQLEKMPKGFSILRNPEPVDAVSEICVAISLNPVRTFVIYHCCDPRPPYEDIEVADFGFFWRTVSYESFRRSCQAIGQRSPLQGQWLLIDHFAPYWFDESEPERKLPISDLAIRKDCPRPISWPALLIKHARSYDWVRRHRDEWPFPVPQGRLDLDGLISQAERYAERMSVSFENTYPEWMLASLKQLVEALRSPEAGLRQSRLSHVTYGLSRALRNNAALARELKEHPEIERQEIEQPVFIVGINRTGTTFLHRLLARDSGFWALRRYETTDPVLPTGEYDTVAGTDNDPRRAYAEELINATNFVDTLAGIHRIDLDEPEEDFMLLWLAFTTWAFTVAHYVPAYGRWLAETGSRNAYAHHRRVVQHFTWQRLQRNAHSKKTWLFKMPFHLMELEALLHAYPDAHFIQTHRDPVEFMGSWNSVVDRFRTFATKPRPPHETGKEQLAMMSRMLNGAMEFRAACTDVDRRWVDIRYVDLVDDPMSVVKDIYARFGWTLAPADTETMQGWLRNQEEERRKEPSHEYRLEDYGITAEAVNDAFSPYSKFTAERGIM